MKLWNTETKAEADAVIVDYRGRAALQIGTVVKVLVFQGREGPWRLIDASAQERFALYLDGFELKDTGCMPFEHPSHRYTLRDPEGKEQAGGLEWQDALQRLEGLGVDARLIPEAGLGWSYFADMGWMPSGGWFGGGAA